MPNKLKLSSGRTPLPCSRIGDFCPWRKEEWGKKFPIRKTGRGVLLWGPFSGQFPNGAKMSSGDRNLPFRNPGGGGTRRFTAFITFPNQESVHTMAGSRMRDLCPPLGSTLSLVPEWGRFVLLGETPSPVPKLGMFSSTSLVFQNGTVFRTIPGPGFANQVMQVEWARFNPQGYQTSLGCQASSWVEENCPLGETPSLVPQWEIFVLNMSGIEPDF